MCYGKLIEWIFFMNKVGQRAAPFVKKGTELLHEPIGPKCSYRRVDHLMNTYAIEQHHFSELFIK